MQSGRRGQIKRVDGRRRLRPSTDVYVRRRASTDVATDVDGRRRAWREWALTLQRQPLRQPLGLVVFRAVLNCCAV